MRSPPERRAEEERVIRYMEQLTEKLRAARYDVTTHIMDELDVNDIEDAARKLAETDSARQAFAEARAACAGKTARYIDDDRHQHIIDIDEDSLVELFRGGRRAVTGTSTSGYTFHITVHGGPLDFELWDEREQEEFRERYNYIIDVSDLEDDYLDGFI